VLLILSRLNRIPLGSIKPDPAARSAEVALAPVEEVLGTLLDAAADLAGEA
jgi:hypothetical protein